MNKYKATLELLSVSILLQVLITLCPELTGYLGCAPLAGLRAVPALLTHMVSHANWMHLIGNFSFGLPFMLFLESKLGHKRFLEYYVACGLGSAALFMLLSGLNHGMIGSSGAIMGVAAGACLSFGESKLEHILGIAMLMALLIPQIAMAPYQDFLGVAVYGHIGGALTAMCLSQRLYKCT